MQRLSKWLRINKFGVLIAIIIVLAGTIVALAVTRPHNKPANPLTSSTNSGDSSGSSIPIGGANPSPADTLASLKANPDYQNPRNDIAYDDLFRNADQYKGTFVHYTGEVVQALGDPGNWNLRVNVTKEGTDPYSYWDDTVFIFSYAQDRVIEKDIISFTGQVNGTQTYKAALGQEITLPSLTIYEDQVVGRGN